MAVDGADSADGSVYIVDTTGRLSRAATDGSGGVLGLDAPLTVVRGTPVSVSTSSGGGLYVVVRSGTSELPVFMLQRLKLRRSR